MTAFNSSDNNMDLIAAPKNTRARRQRAAPMNFFTVAEVAERLEVSTRTVRRWIKSGQLVAHRIRGVVRIARADLDAFLHRHREA